MNFKPQEITASVQEMQRNNIKPLQEKNGKGESLMTLPTLTPAPTKRNTKEKKTVT